MNLNIIPNIHCSVEVLFRPGGYEPPRILYDHELVYVSEGKNNITVGTRKYVVSEGKGIVIPPGVAHFSENPYAVPARRHCIHFDWYGSQPNPDKLWVYLKDDQRRTSGNSAEEPLFFSLPDGLRPLMRKTLGLLRRQPHEIISIRYAFGELLAKLVAKEDIRGRRMGHGGLETDGPDERPEVPYRQPLCEGYRV